MGRVDPINGKWPLTDLRQGEDISQDSEVMGFSGKESLPTVPWIVLLESYSFD